MERKQLRNRMWRFVSIVTAAAALTVLTAQTVLAATTSSYINSVSITVNLDLKAGEELPSLDTGHTGDNCEVTVPDNARYDIESAKWSSSTKSLKLGTTYTMKVTLVATDDYKFSGSYSSSKVKVKGATFVSASRSRSTKLVVTLRTKPVKGELDEPYDAYWESTRMSSSKLGVAKWDTVEDAAYDVNLYRGSTLVHKVTELHTSSYNFYPYMTQKGTYTFRVRAVPTSDEVSKYASRSGWVISDELYMEEEYVSDGSGQTASGNSGYTSATETNQVGWISNNGAWFFRYPNGQYVRDDWANIGGVWYLFDGSGAMKTGWQQKNGSYYFLGDDGAMRIGWYLENDVWYFLNPDGSMATGWIQVAENVYYMNDDGKMVTGWQVIENQTYYFYPDGHKAVNEWVDGLFYVDMNGVWRS